MINYILVSGIIIIALYLIIILISFNFADPGWLQTTWHSTIYNSGGIIGARIADFMFFTFGVLAYIIPVFIFLYFWRIYMQFVHITIFIILFELLGLLVLLFLCCGLINYLIIDDFFYSAPGGIIGCILCDWISSYNSFMCYLNLVLFMFGIFSAPLWFNRFFINFLKIIKNKFISCINILKILFSKNKKNRNLCNHYKLYDQVRVYPTVIFLEKNDCLQHTIYHSCKKKDLLMCF